MYWWAGTNLSSCNDILEEWVKMIKRVDFNSHFPFLYAYPTPVIWNNNPRWVYPPPFCDDMICWGSLTTHHTSYLVFWILIDSKAYDVIVVFQVKWLVVWCSVENNACTGCMVNDVPILKVVQVVARIKSSVTMNEIQLQILPITREILSNKRIPQLLIAWKILPGPPVYNLRGSYHNIREPKYLHFAYE